MVNLDCGFVDDGSIVNVGVVVGVVVIVGELFVYVLLVSLLCLCYCQNIIGCFRVGFGWGCVECGDC